jgi:hypothetical protein
MPLKFDKILGDVRERDDAGFIFTQAVPATVWNITYNLNKKPSIKIVDSTDEVIEGQEEYVDENNIIVTFSALITGKVYLT